MMCILWREMMDIYVGRRFYVQVPKRDQSESPFQVPFDHHLVYGNARSTIRKHFGRNIRCLALQGVARCLCFLFLKTPGEALHKLRSLSERRLRIIKRRFAVESHAPTRDTHWIAVRGEGKVVSIPSPERRRSQ